MYRVGVTGGIGSGKSVVCRMLGILGVPVFEADAEGRRLLAEDHDVLQEVVEQFGEGILKRWKDRSRSARRPGLSRPEGTVAAEWHHSSSGQVGFQCMGRGDRMLPMS